MGVEVEASREDFCAVGVDLEGFAIPGIEAEPVKADRLDGADVAEGLAGALAGVKGTEEGTPLTAVDERTAGPAIGAAAEGGEGAACQRRSDGGCVVDTAEGDRDVLAGAAVGQAVVIAEGDAVGGGDRFTGGEVLAEAVVESEGPVDGAVAGR